MAITHIVMFKFKADAKPEAVQEVPKPCPLPRLLDTWARAAESKR